MKPIVIIQARQSSARLPNKVILPINYIPIIEIIYRRVFSKHYKTVVAISIDKSDDLLCSLLKSKKIPYYRGSLKNVKSRFLDICKDYSDQKLVVRLTADNIFPDKHLINEMINYFFKKKKKYLHINQKSKKVPYGLSVELFELSEIRKLKNTNKKDIEHVTYSIDKENNEFPIDTKFYFEKKASIDEIDDYFLISNFFNFKKISVVLRWNDLIKKFYQFCKSSKSSKFFYEDRTSRIVIGTAQIGNLYGVSNYKKINQKDIKKISHFMNLSGIGNIDTARDYPNSEKLIGKYFSKNNKLKIYTKISNKVNLLKNEKKINKTLLDSIKKSLIKLKIENIECLYIHNMSQDKCLNLKILKILKRIKKNYNIKSIGISISNLSDIDEILDTKIKNYIDIVQVPQNILDNRILKTKLNSFKKNKIEIIIRSIFLQGLIFLDDKSKWPNNLKKFHKTFFKKSKFIIKKLGCLSILELAIMYVYSKNPKSKMIIGINSFSHLTEIYSLLFRKKFNINELKFIEKQFKLLNQKELLSNPTLWS